MMRAYVKNSFLTLEGPEETILKREAFAPSGRARSVERWPLDTPGAMQLPEEQEISVHRLNKLLESGPRTVLELLSAQSEQRALQPQAPALPQRPRRATPSGGAADASGGPTVDELRHLQRKLSEAAGSAAKLSPGKLLAQQRAMSSSSVSTMVSECEELLRSPLQKVMSSGSVSSMVSDIWDEHEEGGTEFGPILEEDVPAAACTGPEEAAGEAEAAPPQRSLQKDFCHPRVPKNLNLAEEFSKCGAEGPPTTMMIRNIPNRYNQRELIRELERLGFGRELIRELERLGFGGAFDFLYLPIDKGTMCNVGYAFVNFVDPSWASRCMQVVENYHFKKNRKGRGKIASVSVAHIQGLEANVKHYEHSAVNGFIAPRLRQRGPVIMASIEKSLQ